jgi:hypothetical protein
LTQVFVRSGRTSNPAEEFSIGIEVATYAGCVASIFGSIAQVRSGLLLICVGAGPSQSSQKIAGDLGGYGSHAWYICKELQ